MNAIPPGVTLPQEEARKAWFAVRVRAASEQLASQQASMLGYEMFVPVYTVKRRWSDRMKAVQAPLFPGYIFCRMDPVFRLPLLKCSTVIEVVSAGRIPLEIDAEEIHAIQRSVQSNRALQPVSYMRVGQPVELDQGPLKGLSGILTDDRTGLVISVTMLQRSVRVSIDECWVDPRCYREFESVPLDRRVA
jgi:transcription antitermination factor NusG